MDKEEEKWIVDCHDNPMYAAEYILRLERDLLLLREIADGMAMSCGVSGKPFDLYWEYVKELEEADG